MRCGEELELEARAHEVSLPVEKLTGLSKPLVRRKREITRPRP